ncbi:hypothetical protein ABPG72_015279 [Tetrahymena utriculariae]
MSGLTPFGTIINTVWSLVFIAPLYIVLATVLSQAFIFLHQYLKDRSTFIYRNLGDISWAFPFTGQNQFKLTQVLLVAIVLALLSMLIIGFMIYSSYGENKYQATKKRLFEEITKEQDKIKKEEQEKAAERREEEERVRVENQEENEQKKKVSDKITQEMQKRKQQELEEMKKRQEEFLEVDKKNEELRRKKVDPTKSE